MGIEATPRQLFVRTLPWRRSRGLLSLGSFCVPCALGRGGLKSRKLEGDGATPRGRFVLRRVLYRPDKLMRPRCALRLAPIREADGWCDAAEDRNYNRPIRHPYPASAEHLWRQDGIYDVVIVLSHNERPRIRNRGSAVFVHIARGDYEPTAGCIALSQRDLKRLLPRLSRQSVVRILP